MRRSLIVIAALGLIFVVLIWRIYLDKQNQQLNGIYLVAFERSEFYRDAERCPPSGTPYWLVPETTADLQGQLYALSKNTTQLYRAVHVSFIGDFSSLGSYGHLGQYRREVRVTRLLAVTSAAGCES